MTSLYFPQIRYAPNDIICKIRSKYKLYESLEYTNDDIILFIRPPEVFSKKHFQYFPNIESIVSDTTGISHLLLADKYPHIKVRTLRSIQKHSLNNITAAADHAITLLNMSLRPIMRAHLMSLNSNNNELLNRVDYLGLAWQDVSLGIIGFGRIGQYVANNLPSSLRKIYTYDTRMGQMNFADKEHQRIQHCSSLKDLLEKANVILISATDDPINNRNIIAENLMENNLHSVVNISRPYMIDEKYVFSALEANKLCCYYSDFPLSQTLTKHSDLLSCGRIVGLPHMGGCTRFSWHQSIRLMSESFLL